jgi:hypothetical protein
MVLLVVILISFYSDRLRAQTDLATITGTVTDASGARLPGASVAIINTTTKTASKDLTNQTGSFSVRGLTVGTYSITIEHPGFKQFQESGLILIAAQVLQVNAQLALGSASETVVVTGTPQLLETQTSNVGTTLESDAINTIPLNATGGRDESGLFYANVATAVGNNYQDHIAGSGNFSKAVFVDGVDTTSGLQGFVRPPGAEGVQEMQLQIGGISADTASTGGGAMLYEIKSGTNSFHGSAFYYTQNEALNANTWEGNYFLSQCSPSDTTCISNNSRPRDRFSDGGGSAGGPLWKNHTFIFGDYEKYSQTNHTLNPLGATVPTAAMLGGDFSALLTQGSNTGPVKDPTSQQPIINPCTGQPYLYGQIFDPLQWRSVNGVPCGVPFAGNIIPSGRISTQTKALIPIYQKYYAPTQPTITSNFPTNVSGPTSQTNFDVNLDHTVKQQRFIFGYNYNYQLETYSAGSGIANYSSGGPLGNWFSQPVDQKIFRISDIITVTPNLLVTVSGSYIRLFVDNFPITNTDPASYGFSRSSTFPTINFGGSNGVAMTGTGTNVIDHYHLNGFHYQETTSWVRGSHSTKFGGEFSAQQDNSANGGNVLTYYFPNNTGGPIDGLLTPWVGSGFANFLLGDVGSATFSPNNPNYGRRKYFNVFAGDDFKVNKRLLLSASLRWDVTMPYHEKNGHWQQFSPLLKNSNWNGYPGAWQFANDGGSSFETANNFYQLGPHLGAAYQLTDKLVLRGAYGVFYVPNNLNENYGSPYQQSPFYIPNNQVNNYVNGSTAFNWDNGYPGTDTNYSRTSEQTYLPGPEEYIDPNALRLGLTQNWNAGVEYEVVKNVLLSATYLANHGTRLHDGSLKAYLNYPSWDTYRSVLLSGHINDVVSNGSQAAAVGVPYPYPGFSGYAWGAIAPFPQLAAAGGQTLSYSGSPVGVSNFGSMILEVKTRSAHGLTMDMNYTLSKSTGSVQGSNNFVGGGNYGFQNVQELQQAKHLLLFYDETNVVKGYVDYNLPLGKNQRFLNKGALLNTLVGGWTIGYHGQYNSGTPIGGVGATYSIPYWMGNIRSNLTAGAHLGSKPKGKLDLNNLADPSNTTFDKSAFTDPPLGQFGNSPYNYDSWRGPGYADEDISLIKSFAFGREGRLHAVLHADFFDAFNRHQYNAPDIGRNDQYFGQTTGVSGNRIGQISGRVTW